jgi:hypothetical protein
MNEEELMLATWVTCAIVLLLVMIRWELRDE